MALAGQFSGVTIDGAALARYMTSENGPVARDLFIQADRVVDEARNLVGYNDSADRKPGPHLRDTIVKRVVKDGNNSISVQVGSPLERAKWHHDGTDPHVINGNPLLVFFWGRAGRVVAFPFVNHPGTQPNPFLVKALDVLPRSFRRQR